MQLHKELRRTTETDASREMQDPYDVVFVAFVKRGHLVVGLMLGVVMAAFGSPVVFYWHLWPDPAARLIDGIVGVLGLGLVGSSIAGLFRLDRPILTVTLGSEAVWWSRSGKPSTRVLYTNITEFSCYFDDVTMATVRFTVAGDREVTLKMGNFSSVELEQIRQVLEARSGKRDVLRLAGNGA